MKITLTLITFFVFQVAFSQIYMWTKILGGTGGETATSVARHSDGSLYISGFFDYFVDFDASDEVNMLVPYGDEDFFVAKHDHYGNLLWVHHFGDYDEHQGHPKMLLDDVGNVYVMGDFEGTIDFDPAEDSEFYLTSEVINEFYILKLSPEGEFIYALKHLGEIKSFKLDHDNNIVLSGPFSGERDFDPSPDEVFLNAELGNRYLVKLNSDGEFLWAKNVGGTSSFVVEDLAVNLEDEIYLVGWFNDTLSFEIDGELEYILGEENADGGFIKFTAEGNGVDAGVLNGPGNDFYRKVIIDNDNNVILAGEMSEDVDFDPGPGESESSVENSSLFIQKLNSEHELAWAGPLNGDVSGAYYYEFTSITTDQYNDIYYSANFRGTIDADPGAGTSNRNSFDENSDALFSKLSAEGTLLWAKNFGRKENDFVHQLILDEVGSIYLAGTFKDKCDFNPNSGDYFVDAVGSNDLYLSKFRQDIVGMDQVEESQELTVYPNPTSDVLNITFNEVNKKGILSIVNVQGQVVYSQVLNEETNHIFSVQDLERGVYIIRLENDKGISQVRFVRG